MPEFTIIKKYSAARKKNHHKEPFTTDLVHSEKYNTLYNNFVNMFAAPGNITAIRRHLMPTAYLAALKNNQYISVINSTTTLSYD
jgi:hypothetical protein